MFDLVALLHLGFQNNAGHRCTHRASDVLERLGTGFYFTTDGLVLDVSHAGLSVELKLNVYHAILIWLAYANELHYKLLARLKSDGELLPNPHAC